MNKTLFKYIFKMQFKSMFLISLSFLGLIFIFDFAEIIRKFHVSGLDKTLLAFHLAFLKIPSTFSEIMHYVYLITATFTLWNLSHSHQITILKSSGHSPQQILYPFLSFAFAISAVWLFAIHPASLSLENKYHELSSIKKSKKIKESNNEIWIDHQKTNNIIFIKDIADNNINGLYIFNLKDNTRIIAKHAEIFENFWTLHNVTLISKNNIQQVEKQTLELNISNELIKTLTKAPKKQTIYSLYKIYKIKKQDKVSLKLYELKLHHLLANAFSFILFALLAAVACFPINRYKSRTNVAIKIIFAAILFRFANSVFESLAYSDIISVQLACWSISLILCFLSVSILIWRES